MRNTSFLLAVTGIILFLVAMILVIMAAFSFHFWIGVIAVAGTLLVVSGFLFFFSMIVR